MLQNINKTGEQGEPVKSDTAPTTASSKITSFNSLNIDGKDIQVSQVQTGDQTSVLLSGPSERMIAQTQKILEETGFGKVATAEEKKTVLTAVEEARVARILDGSAGTTDREVAQILLGSAESRLAGLPPEVRQQIVALAPDTHLRDVKVPGTDPSSVKQVEIDYEVAKIQLETALRGYSLDPQSFRDSVTEAYGRKAVLDQLQRGESGPFDVWKEGVNAKAKDLVRISEKINIENRALERETPA